MESIKALRFGWDADLTNASQRELSQIFLTQKTRKILKKVVKKTV